MNQIELNAQSIEHDLLWLAQVIETRIKSYFEERDWTQPNGALDLKSTATFYTSFIEENELDFDERKIVLLSLAPEIKPELLDIFFINIEKHKKTFVELGGITSQVFPGFIPTIKTALFMLGGNNLGQQMKYAALFDRNNKLYKKNILKEVKSEGINPLSNKMLCLTDNALSRILTGDDLKHEYSIDFPAREIVNRMDWDDLVLPEITSFHLKELLAWIEHGDKLVNSLSMEKHIQPGYRALFYGPPGTGKTLAAGLVGKKAGKPVFRIDLSQVMSKYIGETEKNLEKIFTTAEHRNWILFFDEADALFGKRTSIGSSNDRFANQETAYLLQRIETCDNIVILATNLKGNIDEAFTRRFQSAVPFPIPTEKERLLLWQGAFGTKIVLDKTIDMRVVAEKYDITGGSIVNVVRYAALMTLASGASMISYNILIEGIKREYGKLGRTL